MIWVAIGLVLLQMASVSERAFRHRREGLDWRLDALVWGVCGVCVAVMVVAAVRS